MSLTKVNLVEIVKKQYVHKLKVNIDLLSSLIGIQMLAILFSLGGVTSSGMSGGNLSVDVKYYSSDLVIAFTFIWAFVSSITLTTRANRNQDFTFVTNRLSSSLSNILFLASTSLLGSFTAIMAGNLLKVILYFFFNQKIYGFQAGGKELLVGITITFFYLLLVNSLGYLIGSIVQVSRLFIFLIPVLLFGQFILSEFVQNQQSIKDIWQFYIDETEISFFIIKIIITAGLFYTAATSIFNRMEVKR